MEKKLERAERIKLTDINALSKKYMVDNEDEVRESNQRLLKTVSIIYFVVIIYRWIYSFKILV